MQALPFVFLALLLLSPCAVADESWGAQLFPTKRFNFGRVALQANAEYVFEMENVWEQEVRIVNLHSSCTCTAVSAQRKTLLSLEKGGIVAKLNTTGQHLRDVGATITVILETTVNGIVLQDEVQLEVKAYVRPDVVLTPGVVEFGTIPEGKEMSRQLRIEYAGRPDWKITRILRSNPYVFARAEETKRTDAGEVVYDVTVTLKPGAQPGYIKDVLRFVTNETPTGSREPTALQLPVRGAVIAPLQAKPSPFLIGVLNPGEKVIKSIVVRNDKPFRIRSVTSTDERFRFTFSNQQRPVHLISVLFAARNGDEEENIDQKIFVVTDLSNEDPIVVEVQGHLFGQKPAETATYATPFLPAETRDTAVLETGLPVGSVPFSATSRVVFQTPSH